MNYEGKNWFEKFNTKQKIAMELNNKNLKYFPRERFCAGILELKTNEDFGKKIICEYINNIDDSIPMKRAHKEYVLNIAKKLGVEI